MENGMSSDDGVSGKDGLKEALRLYLEKHTTASVSAQEALYSGLVKAIEHEEEVSEAAIKFLTKTAVGVYIERYTQRRSRKLVESLIDSLRKRDSAKTREYLSHTIVRRFPPSTSLLCRSLSAKAAVCGAWMVGSLHASKSLPHESVVALACVAYHALYTVRGQRLLAPQMLKLVKMFGADEILTTLERLEAVEVVALLTALSLSLAGQGAVDGGAAWGEKLSLTWLESYSKCALSSKTPIPKHLAASPQIVSRLSSEQLSTFYSVAKKALLREPEVAIQGVTNFLKGMSSGQNDALCEEFFTSTMGCLTSTNEKISQTSLEACSYIGKAVSNGAVMKSMLSKIVAHIKESQAKCTPSQKATLWKSVEVLSANSLPSNDQESACDALCKQATPLALSEGNDIVGAAVWSAIEAWAVNCESLPEGTSALFEKCTCIKSVGVRLSAMRATAEVYSQPIIPPELVRCATALLKKVPVTVTNESAEIIPLAVLISLAARRGPQSVEKGIVGTIQAHPLFAKEKFITALTPKDALLIPTLIRTLQCCTHVKFTAGAFGTLLASSLFWPNYGVRKRGMVFAKELASSDVGACCDLLKCLLEGFQSGVFDQIYSRLRSTSLDASSFDSSHKLVVPGWSACQAVECLLPSSISPATAADGKDLTALLVNSLFACSLDRIVEHNGALWIHWIAAHKEWAEPLLQSSDFYGAIVERLYSPQSDLAICANVVRLLVSVGHLGTRVSGAFWHRCSEDIRALDIQLYTSIEQNRVDIYHTPEGTLHNTSVIEMSFDEGGAKNVRRENKAYSYKEQIAEIQLRKELAEKQRREGKLTAKQQKAVEEELKSETKIRAEMQLLHEVAERKLLLLGVAARYSPKHAFENIALLYDIVVPLLKSRLVAEPAASVFLAFRDAFFEPSDNHLHELSAHASLRALESRHLYAEWCEEPLDRQLRRLFALLSSTCMMFKLGGAFGMAKVDPEGEEEEMLHFDEAEEELEMERMTAAKLAFLVPLLERIYTGGSNKESTQLDGTLRATASAFLKDAVCSSFITSEEAGSAPILRLCGLPLKVSVSSSGTSDYIDNLFAVLANFFALLADFPVVEGSEAAAEVESFILMTGGEYFFAHDPTVRRCVLEGFHQMKNLLVQLCLTQSDYRSKLEKVVFLARRDPDADCSTLAGVVWDELHLKTSREMYSRLIDEQSLLSPDNKLVRKEAWQCIHDLLDEYPASRPQALDSLISVYHRYREMLPAKHDAVGRLLKAEVDRWEVRSSIAKAILLLAELTDPPLLMDLMRGVVDEGLGDRDERCRGLMLNAGVTAIKRVSRVGERVSRTTIVVQHGTARLDELLPFLEKRFDEIAPGGQFDNLRTGLIVLIGTLAKHLDAKRSEDKIRKIVARLIESLSTPSQQVQESVAGCLPDLVPMLKSDARELVHSMMSLLSHSDSYGERRGAAYGVAAIVKGLGIVTIKELEIIPTLKGMFGQSGRAKESALLCVEMLCRTIGKLFEPYSVQLLPDLLRAFGDQSESVRRAADDAARAMMKALSAHGLKLVLPSLLKVLEEDEKWRTKCAATEMLGAMAHCAPRQLSACLPKIVPRLCEVLTDSHAKVQKSGEKALKQIAQVIRSPEFLSISSHLVAALMDPAVKTKAALEIVVNTRFVHFVDSPSLALLIPIVNRSFGDRNMDTKRMGANIIANLYSLADHKEIAEYLTMLVPGVRKLLVDPAPEVRTMASKALGAIIRHSPPAESEKLQAEIVPWLKECLVSKNSAVDRSGAAQGMCEIIAALGDEFLKANMPTVIRITESSSTEAHIRDGYLLLYIYLPSILGEQFLPYIPLIVPSILRALADETEYVRDSAMKAAQRLITVYASHAKRLLLPQMLAAVIHENWRIRHASVKLIGEYLFQIGGISGKMTSDTADEDETLGIETVNKAIVRSIGQESRDEILASLYLARHDVSLLVRQTSSHIWKVVVGNTQRTVKELLPNLFELILRCIASEHEDRQQMAQRCLAEMTKKMGEKIIAAVMPLLERRLQPEDGTSAGDVESRRQVAVAINELISNATREAIENSSSTLIPPVKMCLSDSDELVRNFASTAFISLYQIVGPSAVDEVVLSMLDDFSTNDNHDALSGLCLVVAKGRGLLASLMPRITKPPINSTALCQLAAANPDSLSRNLSKILEALLCPVENLGCSLAKHVDNVAECLSSISDEEGVTNIISTLLKKSSTSIVASTILRQYVLEARVGLEGVALLLLQGLLPLYDSADEPTMTNSVETLNALVKDFNSEQLLELVMTLKRAAGQLYSSHENKKTGEVETMPALRRPDGWKALLAVAREGLLAGTMETKELAGIAMTQLIAMSSESGLKPYAVNMAGPFIRVLGDRQPPPHVKIAILNALLKLLDKVPNILKPFLPQMKSMLQRIQSEESATSPTLSKLAEQGTQRLAELYG